MKNVILLLLMCTAQFAVAQISLQDLESKLNMEYEVDSLEEFINLANALPMRVPVEDNESEEWQVARKKCAELYLMWYQKMFASRFRLDNKRLPILSAAGIAKLKTEAQKQHATESNAKNKVKNKSIATFLIAEQRLKLFMKNSFKSRKRQRLAELLLDFDKKFDSTSDKIMDEVLVRNLSFVIYENRISKESIDMDNVHVMKGDAVQQQP